MSCGGSDCVSNSTMIKSTSSQGNSEETELFQNSCNTGCCPVDGGWGEWTSLTTCSATCGGGTQTRTRECNNPALSCGGNDCDFNSTMIKSNSSQGLSEETDARSCNTDTCPVSLGEGKNINVLRSDNTSVILLYFEGPNHISDDINFKYSMCTSK